MAEEEEETCAAQCQTPLKETVKVIAVCPSGHKMHAECVYCMYETTSEPACPICRDSTLSLLKDMIIKADRNSKIDDSSDDSLSLDGDDSDGDQNDQNDDTDGKGNNYFDFTVSDNGYMTVNIYGLQPAATPRIE